MKKHFIVLAALCACAASAARAEVSLWGIGEASVRRTSGMDAKYAPSQEGVWSVVSGVRNVSRWGLHVGEDLGGGLRALVELESGINLDTGSSSNSTKLFDRGAYMGLQGGWGRFTLGRQTNLQADALLLMDPLGLRFASLNPGVAYSALSVHGLAHDWGSAGSTTNAYRLDNSLKYVGKFGPVIASAMASLGEAAGRYAPSSSTGLGLAYKSNGLIVAAAASRLRDPASLELETGFLGASYELGAGWRLSGYYSNTRAETGNPALTRQKVKTIGISKAITPSFDLITALSHFARERTGLGDDGFTRFIAFGEYKLSKQTVAFVEFDNTSWRGGMQQGGKKHGRGLSLGMSYRF